MNIKDKVQNIYFDKDYKIIIINGEKLVWWQWVGKSTFCFLCNEEVMDKCFCIRY